MLNKNPGPSTFLKINLKLNYVVCLMTEKNDNDRQDEETDMLSTITFR
jgi:hypothetical protein